VRADSLRVRALNPADLDQVGELVQRSFAADLRPFMVATQKGWVDHLRVKLAHPRLHLGQHLGVAEREGRVVAFADYRTSANDGFLSYICVAQEERGQGLARTLFEWLVRGSQVDRVGLDVFADNLPARSLYAAMGFNEVSRQTWWTRPLTSVIVEVEVDPGVDPRIDCRDLHASLEALRRFGFCQVTARMDDDVLVFGRLGQSVLRVPGLGRPNERRALRALAAEFEELEQLFVVAPGEEPPAGFNGAHRLASALRLERAQVEQKSEEGFR
jgi:ribosomal protein S18 acetylase RimI-like enzyme